MFQRRLLLAVLECGFGAGGPRLKPQGAAAAGPRRAEAEARTAGRSRTEARRDKNRKAQPQQNRGVARQKPQGAAAAEPRRAEAKTARRSRSGTEAWAQPQRDRCMPRLKPQGEAAAARGAPSHPLVLRLFHSRVFIRSHVRVSFRLFVSICFFPLILF